MGHTLLSWNGSGWDETLEFNETPKGLHVPFFQNQQTWSCSDGFDEVFGITTLSIYFLKLEQGHLRAEALSYRGTCYEVGR